MIKRVLIFKERLLKRFKSCYMHYTVIERMISKIDSIENFECYCWRDFIMGGEQVSCLLIKDPSRSSLTNYKCSTSPPLHLIIMYICERKEI